MLQRHTERPLSDRDRLDWLRLRLAELDSKEQAVLAFCRNLARSRPRPARAEAERLVALGYAPLAVAEIASCVAGSCFYNRVITITACPPQADLEAASRGPLEVLKGIATGFLQGIAPGGDVRNLQAAVLAQVHGDLARRAMRAPAFRPADLPVVQDEGVAFLGPQDQRRASAAGPQFHQHLARPAAAAVEPVAAQRRHRCW